MSFLSFMYIWFSVGLLFAIGYFILLVIEGEICVADISVLFWLLILGPLDIFITLIVVFQLSLKNHKTIWKRK